MLENLTTNKFSNIRRVQSDGYCSRFLLSRNCTSRVKGFISRRGANDPNGFSGTPLADWPKRYALGSRPADIADEYRAVLISYPSRIRNQTILFCLSPKHGPDVYAVFHHTST